MFKLELVHLMIIFNAVLLRRVLILLAFDCLILAWPQTMGVQEIMSSVCLNSSFETCWHVLGLGVACGCFYCLAYGCVCVVCVPELTLLDGCLGLDASCNVMYVCVSACLSLCMYVCMYVCMKVCT